MSAFIVSKRHIDLLLTAGLAYGKQYALRWRVDGMRDCRELTPETASAVGVMLWAENYKSVNHRYDEKDIESELYEFKPYRAKVEPVAVLKAVRCFEYQSCEHPEWEESEAFSFCEALKAAAVAVLPGYEEAAWAID